MHALMSKIGPVIECERIGVKEGDLNRVLIAKMFKELRK